MLCAMESWASSSKAEPIAMSRKRAKSAEVLRDDPSAILEGMETAARCIWLIKPYFSFEGKLSVIW